MKILKAILLLSILSLIIYSGCREEPLTAPVTLVITGDELHEIRTPIDSLTYIRTDSSQVLYK